MPQLVSDLVKKRVDTALLPPAGDKLPPLNDVVREIVKGRVNVLLANLGPPKGPVVLTCK